MSWAQRYPAERIVPYDAQWSARFAELEASLREMLGAAWVVEHVGSTSVPGLWAKPVIDLALRVPQGPSRDVWLPLMERGGWSDLMLLGDHEAIFLLGDGVRLAIAHLFTTEQWPDAHLRLFSNWLRAHDADRDAYADLKQELVIAGVWGSDYTRAKAKFVEDTVNRARTVRGLHPITHIVEGAAARG